MKVSAVLLPLLLFLHLPAEKIQAQLVLGARETAMGQAVTALEGTPWAAYANPAVLPGGGSQAAAYSIRYYGLRDLTDMGAVWVTDRKQWAASGAVHHYGGEVFAETRLRGVYAFKAGKQVRIGLSGGYTHVRYGGTYESRGAASLDAGLLWTPDPAFSAGFRTVHLAGGKLPGARETARELAWGAAYRPGGDALLTLDLVKDVRYALAVRAGSEIVINKTIALRAGVTTEPSTISLGVGLQRESVRVNVVMQRHQVGALGMSPGIDVVWRF